MTLARWTILRHGIHSDHSRVDRECPLSDVSPRFRHHRFMSQAVGTRPTPCNWGSTQSAIRGAAEAPAQVGG